MNREEALIVRIAEEAVEVAQRATKAFCFGMEQVQVDSKEPSPNSQNPDGKTNRERLEDELCDLLAVCQMAGIELDLVKFNARMIAKKEKVERYLQFARELGVLQ